MNDALSASTFPVLVLQVCVTMLKNYFLFAFFIFHDRQGFSVMKLRLFWNSHTGLELSVIGLPLPPEYWATMPG